VVTDKAAYAPGETAKITASGFAPGETVQFLVLHNDDTPNTGAGHQLWQVMDGSSGDLDTVVNGEVQTTWYVNEDDNLGSAFVVTAKGLVPNKTAIAYFTDDNVGGSGPGTRLFYDDFPPLYWAGFSEPRTDPAKWVYDTVVACNLTDWGGGN
jgi:hypothetical protein